MSAFFQRSESQIFVEFGEGAAHIAASDRTLELPLETGGDGEYTAAAIEAVRNAIGLVAQRESSQVFCLLPARGVSLRKISLPANSRAEIERLLPLQIDAQFPIGASELAWGYVELPNSRGVMKELLVAAIKKETVERFRAIIAGAGFAPVFCVAALARRALIRQAARGFALLEAGRGRSELLVMEPDGETSLRTLLWGTDSTEALAPMLAGAAKLYVSGRDAAGIASRAGAGIPAEVLPNVGPTSAIAGMREMLRRGETPLVIQAERDSGAEVKSAAQWRWAAAAVLLGLVSLGLYYAEPMIRQRQLARRIEELTARQKKLPNLEREVTFLQFIKTNQPSYLDAIATLAASTAPGTKMDALTISRRGELSFRGMAPNAQAATTIRAKLIESGHFSIVTLDEQTPVQNQQQVNFRLTAVLRPESERPAPAKVEEKPAAQPAEKPGAPGAAPAVATPTPPSQAPPG